MSVSAARIELPASTELLSGLRAGDFVSLYGSIYTMRDAGHLRALEYLDQHDGLPYGLAGQALFYAGPTPALGEKPFGAIGPTTASRMDFATPQLLRAGIRLMLGKGRRSPEVAAACRETGAVYLVTTGGAAAYLASFVSAAELLAWEDLGTEALRRLTLDGLPAFVAIDSLGNDLYAAAATAHAPAALAPTPAAPTAHAQAAPAPTNLSTPSPSTPANAAAAGSRTRTELGQ